MFHVKHAPRWTSIRLAVSELMPPFEIALQSAESASGIWLSRTQMQLIAEFCRILTESNTRMHLVSRSKDPTAVIVDQILESLLVHPLIEILKPLRILDLGSGAGFPGIPLSILNPSCSFVLLDASQRRTTHLLRTAKRLSLKNVLVVRERAENLAKMATHQKAYDLVTARAVTDPSHLMLWARTLLGCHGTLLVYMGPDEAARLHQSVHSLPSHIRPQVIRCLDTRINVTRPRRLVLLQF